MPRYDYECESCHHRFELMQSFHDEPVATCPLCQNTARRKFSLVPVIFKGSGWYVNDYGNGKNSTISEPEKKGDEKSKDTTEARAEANTEAKKEPEPSKPEAS